MFFVCVCVVVVFFFVFFFLGGGGGGGDIKVFEPTEEVDSTVKMKVRCYR